MQYINGNDGRRPVHSGAIGSAVSLLCFLFLGQSLAAQTPLPYVVDFNNGLPGSWTQPMSGLLPWIESDTLGVDGTGSILVDLGNDSRADSAWIETPSLDLTSVDHPLFRCRLALVKHSFLPPALSLFYDDGRGWRRLRTWGQSIWWIEDVELVETGENFGVPLGRPNLKWVEVTYDLEEFGDLSSVRFAFAAHVVNGGWALLDDVAFVPAGTSGLQLQDGEASLPHVLLPNPARASAVLRLSSPSSSSGFLEVIDLLGRTVVREPVEKGQTEYPLRIDRLAAGTYFVRLLGETGEVIAIDRLLKE